MTILERKVNAIARYILARNEQDEATACKELDVLMSGNLPAGTVREEIDALLTDLGVHAKLIGYEQVHEAIYLCVEQKDIIRAITKELYPKVAEICGTTASRTERAIRHAVEVCFDRCDAEHLQSYFGCCINPMKGKLTNGEFIARCANIIRERIGGGQSMYFRTCQYCGAYLDPEESCDCQGKEETASRGANTESGTGKISIPIISNQTNFVNEKEINHG